MAVKMPLTRHALTVWLPQVILLARAPCRDCVFKNLKFRNCKLPCERHNQIRMTIPSGVLLQDNEDVKGNVTRCGKGMQEIPGSWIGNSDQPHAQGYAQVFQVHKTVLVAVHLHSSQVSRCEHLEYPLSCYLAGADGDHSAAHERMHTLL